MFIDAVDECLLQLMALLRRYVKLYSDEPSDEKAMEARLQELLTQFDANKVSRQYSHRQRLSQLQSKT